MLAGLKSRDFPSGRLMFQPDAENVSGCVDIAIMRCPAVRTFPTSHSKRTHTFRTAGRYRPAARARLGTVSFVGFDEHGSVPSGLVAEHVPELRPASVEHGFSHPCLGEASGVHIADDDQTILSDNPGRLLVKVVAASARNLCVDSSRSLLIPGALSGGQLGFVFTVVPKVRDFLSVTEGGKSGQAEINTNRTAACGKIVSNLALECRIPTPASVLYKSTGLHLAFDVSRFPKAKGALPQHNGVAIYLNATRGEWHPAQRTLRAEAGTKARTPAMLVSRLGELAADAGYRVGMQAKACGDTLRERHKVIDGGPAAVAAALSPSLGFALSIDAEVPDLIAGNSMTAEITIPAFNAILEADYAQCAPVSLRPTSFLIAPDGSGSKNFSPPHGAE